MKCSKDHDFLYPSYDRDSDMLICPTCREPIEVTEIPRETWGDVLAGDNALEDEVKDLRELVKTLTSRVERLERRAGIVQEGSGRSLFQRIRAFFQG